LYQRHLTFLVTILFFKFKEHFVHYKLPNLGQKLLDIVLFHIVDQSFGIVTKNTVEKIRTFFLNNNNYISKPIYIHVHVLGL
jgi:hypothetical protein